MIALANASLIVSEEFWHSGVQTRTHGFCFFVFLFLFAFEGVEEVVQMMGGALDKCPVVIYHAQELL